MRGMRRWVVVAFAATALALAAVAAAAALHASPAHAYDAWEHDGATGCMCHLQGKPTDATCAACHTGFKSLEGYTCWSCHYPGQDTTMMSFQSRNCALPCHMQSNGTVYDKQFAHGIPHRGALPQCLGCHSPSDGPAKPGTSPHHNGGKVGMSPCSRCHDQKKHLGKVDCEACHAKANDYHTWKAKSPGFRQCTGCHAMRHAGRTISSGKCATCHKGTGNGAQKLAQHSLTVTKALSCNQAGCHNKRLHASGKGSGIKSCATCHGGTYHGTRMPLPSNATCERCHTSAGRHAGGYSCALCHADAVHARFPHAGARL